MKLARRLFLGSYRPLHSVRDAAVLTGIYSGVGLWAYGNYVLITQYGPRMIELLALDIVHHCNPDDVKDYHYAVVEWYAEKFMPEKDTMDSAERARVRAVMNWLHPDLNETARHAASPTYQGTSRPDHGAVRRGLGHIFGSAPQPWQDMLEMPPGELRRRLDNDIPLID